MFRVAHRYFHRVVHLNRLRQSIQNCNTFSNQFIIRRLYANDQQDAYHETGMLAISEKNSEVTEEEEENEKEQADKANKRSIPLLGGGLEKLQGGLREENYFTTQNKEIIRKLHENSAKVNEIEPMQPVQVDEWIEYEKSRNLSRWIDGSSISKQKNLMEEKYFLSEQLDTLKMLSDKMMEFKKKRKQEESDDLVKQLEGTDPFEDLMKDDHTYDKLEQYQRDGQTLRDETSAETQSDQIVRKRQVEIMDEAKPDEVITTEEKFKEPKE